MKVILSIGTFLAFFFSCNAQKPALDETVFGKWPTIKYGGISNDGRYSWYMVDNVPVGSQTIVITSTDAAWKKEFAGAQFCRLSADSRTAVITLPGDSLCLLTLPAGAAHYISGVIDNFLSPNGKRTRLFVKLRSARDSLVIYDLQKKKQIVVENVKAYKVAENGDAAVIVTQPDASGDQRLQWLDCSTGLSKTIWKGPIASDIVFDGRGRQIVFKTTDTASASAFWYYTAGTDTGARLVDATSLPDNTSLSTPLHFSNDGFRLFFTVKSVRRLPPFDSSLVKLDVWNYRDTKLQSEQLTEVGPTTSEMEENFFTYVVDIRTRRITRLEQDGDVIFQSQAPYRNDSFLLLLHHTAVVGYNELYSGIRLSYVLVSTHTGQRIPLPTPEHIVEAQLSPGGKYFLYFDPTSRNYFTYDLQTRAIHNLTGQLIANWTSDNMEDQVHVSAIGRARWVKDDADILLYDQHDIWKVDPQGQRAPVCLTNGYGARNQLELRIAFDGEVSMPIDEKESVLLTAFSPVDKSNGFFKTTLSKARDPQLLVLRPEFFMGPYHHPHIPYDFQCLQKARDTERYVVRKMNASNSPNYFSTSDFKNFTALSDVHPEKNYNWMTSELVNWPLPNGKMSQGVLYKPENFDSTIKYPLLFYYYERLSDQLHVYHAPEGAEGPINIPMMVSNGYLVFTPDIHYTTGNPGQGALDAVLSATDYLKQFPWVDTIKMGLQGHSWGGFETNYIITRTNRYAAAVSAAGVSDFISMYGQIGREGGAGQAFYEHSQPRMGSTLWESPRAYINQSAVFSLDRIETPLLLIANKEDGNVPFQQGVEMFTSLRRLGKKVWMLQYDGEAHVLISEEVKKDYSKRLLQFFDHYLKDKPAPAWMIRGIPAAMKGRTDGLQQDTSSKDNHDY